MDGREVMQLLQARGWYGVFLSSVPKQIDSSEDGGLLETFTVSVRLRPLVGWMSAEGGFQGLYYHEGRGALYSHAKIVEEFPGMFAGDICVDEVRTIQAILQQRVVEKVRAYLQGIEKRGMIRLDLSEETKILREKGRLPIPRPIE